MPRIVFVHGMFQNSASWQKWVEYFSARGHECIAPSWPLHEGDPATLRANPPPMLGRLRLKEVIAAVEMAVGHDRPILIGHSVGGLIAQILLNRDRLSAAVAIAPVAPNRMLDLDFSFFKNAMIIANPLQGDSPIAISPEMFHGAFANTLEKEQAAAQFELTAVHDSRNVFRDCLGPDGEVDLDRPHRPLLIVAAENDQIIPADLCRKNAEAYGDPASCREFPGRSHYICNEPGWEEVAGFVAQWLEQQGALRTGSTELQDQAGLPG